MAAAELGGVAIGAAVEAVIAARGAETIGESAFVAGNGSGVTVLGHFPGYLQTAEELGANAFSVPAEKWAQMSVTEQWAANQAFLDGAIARGDSFVFSHTFAEAGSSFERELMYLQQQRVFLGFPR
jgi:hypothetical protein